MGHPDPTAGVPATSDIGCATTSLAEDVFRWMVMIGGTGRFSEKVAVRNNGPAGTCGVVELLANCVMTGPVSSTTKERFVGTISLPEESLALVRAIVTGSPAAQLLHPDGKMPLKIQ